jgi:hypothetical protein
MRAKIEYEKTNYRPSYKRTYGRKNSLTKNDICEVSHSPVITTPQDLLREAKYDLKLFWPSGSSHPT